MTFKSDTLSSEIGRFTLYVTNGDLPCDAYHFRYHVWIENVIAVSIDLFTQASELFNKQFVFDSTKTFQSNVCELIELVMLVQSRYKSQVIGKRGRAEPDHADGAAKKAKTGTPKPDRMGIPNNDTVLANALGMCYGCEQIMPSGKAGFEAHLNTCKHPYAAGVSYSEFTRRISYARDLAEKRVALT